MDIENVADKTGFPALARKIAINPDYEAFIFRKFDRLSARNLLHLESKLAYLEFKLDKADELAANSRSTETLRSIRTWEAFEDLAKRDEAGPEHARMRIAEEIREVLKEYRKTDSSNFGIFKLLSKLDRGSPDTAEPNCNARGTKETGPRSRVPA